MLIAHPVTRSVSRHNPRPAAGGHHRPRIPHRSALRPALGGPAAARGSCRAAARP